MGIDNVGGGAPAYKPPPAATTGEVKKTEPAAAPAEAKSAGSSISSKLSEGFDAVKKKLMSVSGRYQAPTASLPVNSDLANAVNAQRSSLNASDGGFASNAAPQSYVMLQKMDAVATREIDPNQKVNFLTPDGKKDMIERSSQINPVSIKAGNKDTCCGGASVTNAMILSAKTPAEAKANADAMRATAKSSGVPITPAEEQALKNMSTGSMSANDSWNLQQLNMKIIKPDSQGGGIANEGEMAKGLAQLRANGALKNGNIEFNNSRLPDTNPPANHWAVTVNGDYATSLNRYGYHGASLQKGAPWDQTRHADNESWRGGVSLKNDPSPAKMEVSYRQLDSQKKDVPGKMRSATLDNLEQYKTYDGFMQLENRLRDSANTSVDMPRPD